MLQITRSTRTLKEELRSAKGLLRDIIGVLDSVDDKTNLTKAVGGFIPNMPEYKVLAKDAEAAKQLLRKICSGELKEPEAIVIFSEAYDEVEKLYMLLKDFG